MAETLILQSTGLQQKLWDQDQDRDPDHKRDRDRDKDPDQDQVQDRDQDTYHLHNRKTRSGERFKKRRKKGSKLRQTYEEVS